MQGASLKVPVGTSDGSDWLSRRPKWVLHLGEQDQEADHWQAQLHAGAHCREAGSVQSQAHDADIGGHCTVAATVSVAQATSLSG